MSRLTELLPASFKGIPFYVLSERMDDGGRRIILHEYPNSNRRFVEDQGQIPQIFTINAFVHGPDFLTQADKLEQALNEPGSGSLSLPTLGIKKVFAMPYKMDASQKSVGEVRFVLKFAMGDATSGPVRGQESKYTVYDKVDTAMFEIGEVLERETDKYIPTDTSNVQNAIYDLGQMVTATNAVLSVVNNSSDLESTISLILANAPQIVRSGELMKTSFMQNLWKTVSVGLQEGSGFSELIGLTKFGANLTLTLSDVYRAYDTATDEGFDYGIPTWPVTTSQRIFRNRNRLNIVNAGRSSALVNAYAQGADATYTTDEQVQEATAELEEQYNRLMNDDTIDPNIIQSDPLVRNAIDDVRASALSVMAQKEQAAYSLTTINNDAPISAFIESYQLYAEEFSNSEQVVSRAIELRNLNPLMAADKLKGETTVMIK